MLPQVVYGLAPNQAAEIIDNFSVMTVDTGGVLVTDSELDYEEKRVYAVVVEAVDRAGVGYVNTAQATILVEVALDHLHQDHHHVPVQVSDIPDQPPEWVSVAAVTRIPEDIPLFSPVGSNTPYNYVCLYNYISTTFNIELSKNYENLQQNDF